MKKVCKFLFWTSFVGLNFDILLAIINPFEGAVKVGLVGAVAFGVGMAANHQHLNYLESLDE